MTDATNTEAKYILESIVEEREAAMKEKLRIATECLVDVRSELTHAGRNIDTHWCIDQLSAALEKLR